MKFDHQAVVPVDLSAAAASRWFETDLIFKIFSRNSNQKKVSVFGLTSAGCLKVSAHDLPLQLQTLYLPVTQPVPIGKAVHPLHCLLLSKQLSQSLVLPVQSIEGNADVDVGPLKVMYVYLGKYCYQTICRPSRT